MKNGSYEMRERFAISSSAEEAVEEKIGTNSENLQNLAATINY